MDNGKLRAPAPKTRCLRFETKDDSINYVNEVVKRCDYLAARHGFPSLREDYIEGKNEVLLDLNIGVGVGKASNLQLIIRRAPFVNNKFERAATFGDGVNESALVLKLGVYNSLVRISGKLGDSPEDWIPSVVWLKFHRKSDDPSVNMLTVPSSGATQISETLPEREVDPLCVISSQNNSRVTHSLIEGEANFFEDTRNQSSNFQWHPVLKSQIDDSLSGLSIDMGNNFVRAVVRESVIRNRKVCQLFFSALD